MDSQRPVKPGQRSGSSSRAQTTANFYWPEAQTKSCRKKAAESFPPGQ